MLQAEPLYRQQPQRMQYVTLDSMLCAPQGEEKYQRREFFSFKWQRLKASVGGSSLTTQSSAAVSIRHYLADGKKAAKDITCCPYTSLQIQVVKVRLFKTHKLKVRTLSSKFRIGQKGPAVNAQQRYLIEPIDLVQAWIRFTLARKPSRSNARVRFYFTWSSPAPASPDICPAAAWSALHLWP